MPEHQVSVLTKTKSLDYVFYCGINCGLRFTMLWLTINGLHPLLKRHMSKLSESLRVPAGEMLEETTDIIHTVHPGTHIENI